MDNNLILSLDGKILTGIRDESVQSVIIPDSVTEIGYGAFHECTSLKELVVSPDNPIYYLCDGVLYEK